MAEKKKKSELSRAFAEDGALKTHVGGQALLEGIMMRGRYNWSVAVREPEGTIYLEEHDLASGKNKNGWLYWPIVRGCRAFVESLALGYKALEVASAHAFVEEDEDEQEKPAIEAAAAEAACAVDTREDADSHNDFSWKNDFGNPDEMIDALGAQRTLEVVCEPASEADVALAAEEEPVVESDAVDYEADSEAEANPKPELEPEIEPEVKEKEPLLSGGAMAASMVVGVIMGIVLFIVAPAFVTNLIVGEYDDKTLLWNIVDGVLRIAIFVFYIWLIGRMSEIKRMFGYHGAEHKTIHCYEHSLPLTPENARSFPRLHVRCGTAFLIMVMIIAIFVYTVVPVAALIQAIGIPDGPLKLVFVILTRIILMPIIAGVSYEITVKWAGTHPSNPLVKVILWPGLQMQRLTTSEPDDGQIECAIAAMKLILEREEAEAARTGGVVGDLRTDGAAR